MSNWPDFFNYAPMKELAGFLSSYNMASQTVALDANANDIQSSGGGACMINGVFIPALAADAALDISADNVGDATGVSIADDYDQYFLILADADGTLSVWKAGDAAATGEAVLSIPDFDTETYCAVAIMKVVNDSGDALVIGTTALTGDVTFYQLTGPIFPAWANIVKR